ncbi:MAG TPA: response regulator [Deferrimonas sp.]|jgi:DNA-binding NtrC family response regulator
MSDAILLVDDEANVLKALQRALIDEDWEVQTASSGDEALALLKEARFKVIVSDERMPGMTGSEFLSLASLRAPETVRIMLTGHASLDGAMRAVNGGEIYRFLIKPWNDVELRMAIRSGIERYDLDMENRRLLSLVRRQEYRLQQAERLQPGITIPEKNADGSFRVEELSDGEIKALLRDCGVGTPEKGG